MLTVHVVLFPREHETGLAGVCLKLFLLLFKLDFQILKLLGEPLTRVFGGFPPGLEALIDVLLRERVAEVGRHLSIRRIARHLHDSIRSR